MRPLNLLSYVEEGDFATISLGPPINIPLIKDLEAICEHLEDDSPCKVVIFRGSESCFCGQVDLTEFNLGKPLDIHGFHRWEKALTRIERMPKFTIAALEGSCSGAGLHLALVCDQRLTSTEATFCADEVRRGFLPGMAVFRLAKYIGLGRAKSMVLKSQRIDATSALAWGLVDQLEAPERFDSALAAFASECVPVSTVAHELGRRLLNESFGIQREEFIGNFLAAQHRAITSETFTRLLKQTNRE